MPKYDITVSCPVHDSFRVQQVAGMFDVPLAEKAVERFEVELPADSDDWQIGLIVGPSGSGKSTVARRAWGQRQGDKEKGRQGDPCANPTRLEPDFSLSPCLPVSLSSPAWPSDRAVIDCFGDVPVRKIVELFTAVGFGSPPSWIKPYWVLSGGERFRCDLARALCVAFRQDKETRRQGDKETRQNTSDGLDHGFYLSPCLPVSLSSLPLVVFDEFTSVVDRTVAKVCSAAIAKGIRRGNIPCRFVAVTCHYDVAEWLEADWVLDMATQELHWRPEEQGRMASENFGFRIADCGLEVVNPQSAIRNPQSSFSPSFRRPTIRLEIHRARVEAWELFKRHHYLSARLAPQARCYLATWDGVPVHFSATLPVITKRNHRRFTRIVTLPDYQGLGIGMRCVAAVAELHRAEGLRINVTSSHPALIHHCRRSPLWRTVNVRKTGRSALSSRPKGGRRSTSFQYSGGSAGRAVVSFEYVGEGSRIQ